MTKTHETDEFEDWARLAASIGQYTRRPDVDMPQTDGKSESNGRAVNGRAIANGHVNGNGEVDQLPSFLLQGPAVDDEPPASEPDRVAVVEKANGVTGPPRTAAGRAVPDPFLLMDALSEDLEIPPEPAAPPMDELQQPSRRTALWKGKDNKEKPPTAVAPSGNGLWRLLRHAVGRKAKVTKERPSVAVKSSEMEGPRRDFDGLPSSPAIAKRVGVAVPPPRDRLGYSRRRLRHWLKKGVAVTAVGVAIGGVAVAILYIVVVATTSAFSV